MESYSNYNLDDILVRTFMMPAVMPKDKINMINMPNNTYPSNQNNSTINNFKFLDRKSVGRERVSSVV